MWDYNAPPVAAPSSLEGDDDLSSPEGFSHDYTSSLFDMQNLQDPSPTFTYSSTTTTTAHTYPFDPNSTTMYHDGGSPSHVPLSPTLSPISTTYSVPSPHSNLPSPTSSDPDSPQQPFTPMQDIKPLPFLPVKNTKKASDIEQWAQYTNPAKAYSDLYDSKNRLISKDVAIRTRITADNLEYSHVDDAHIMYRQNQFSLELDFFGELAQYSSSGEEAFHVVKWTSTGSAVVPVEGLFFYIYAVKHQRGQPFDPELVELIQACGSRNNKDYQAPGLCPISNGRALYSKLQFRAATLNNARSGKSINQPNPQQQFYRIIIALVAKTADSLEFICTRISPYLVVRGQNPGRFKPLPPIPNTPPAAPLPAEPSTPIPTPAPSKSKRAAKNAKKPKRSNKRARLDEDYDDDEEYEAPVPVPSPDALVNAPAPVPVRAPAPAPAFTTAPAPAFTTASAPAFTPASAPAFTSASAPAFTPASAPAFTAPPPAFTPLPPVFGAPPPPPKPTSAPLHMPVPLALPAPGPESTQWSTGSNDTIFTGKVGINTATPTEALSVVGNIMLTGDIIKPSDQRVKTNIQPVNTASQLANIEALQIYDYELIHGKGPGINDMERGIMAQQLQKILPNATRTVNNVTMADGEVVDELIVVQDRALLFENIGATKELSTMVKKDQEILHSIDRKFEERIQGESIQAEKTLDAAGKLLDYMLVEKTDETNNETVCCVFVAGSGKGFYGSLFGLGPAWTLYMLGFFFPLLWLFGCLFMLSHSKSKKISGSLHMITFLIFAAAAGLVYYPGATFGVDVFQYGLPILSLTMGLIAVAINGVRWNSKQKLRLRARAQRRRAEAKSQKMALMRAAKPGKVVLKVKPKKKSAYVSIPMDELAADAPRTSRDEARAIAAHINAKRANFADSEYERSVLMGSKNPLLQLNATL